KGPAPAEFTVMGDPGRLQQVFLNLLSNAVKFTPTGGRIEVSMAHKGNGAVVTVADTGEGISPEFLPFVFDRFRQADRTSTRSHMGLGLGLAIVRHVIDLHGGAVRVTSAGEGKGSSFTVTIPLAIGVEGVPRKPVADRMPGTYGPTGGMGVRVLVIEDDPE